MERGRETLTIVLINNGTNLQGRRESINSPLFSAGLQFSDGSHEAKFISKKNCMFACVENNNQLVSNAKNYLFV